MRTKPIAVLVGLAALIAAGGTARSDPAQTPSSSTAGGDAAAAVGSGDDATELAKKLQNPVADVYTFPFQSNTNFGYGPHGGTQEVLNVQPVIPLHLNSDWSLITRTVLPIVWTPDLSPAESVPFGTGPTSVTALLAPAQPNHGWLWGVGPVVQVPTISNRTLGSSVWGGGPAAVLVYMQGPIVTGALLNNIWSFGGARDPGEGGAGYSTFMAQPFFNYNFPGGWYVGTSPEITADWRADGTKWTVPVGAQVGRVIKLGALPINLQLGAYYNVVKPTDGANWDLRTQVSLIF